MHDSDIISLLLYEAGRKSEVAALVKRVEALTDEEIASAHVPLPWYRKALTELRKRCIAERLADVMVRASNGTNGGPMAASNEAHPNGTAKWADGMRPCLAKGRGPVRGCKLLRPIATRHL